MKAYQKDWEENVFHWGEKAMQEWEGSREKAQRIGLGKIGTEVNPEMRDFMNKRHAVYVGSVDEETGEVWATAIFADPVEKVTLKAGIESHGHPCLTPQPMESELGTASADPPPSSVPFCDTCGVNPASSSVVGVFQASAYHRLVTATATKVRVLKAPPSGDPLWRNASKPGAPVSITFLEFETRKRMRTNGVVSDPMSQSGFSILIAETFTTCSRYIQRRTIDAVRPSESCCTSVTTGLSRLPDELVSFVTGADTMMLATCQPGSIRGCDVSHRRGRPGFVRVIDNRRLVWAEYHGKGLNQTLGNVLLNPHSGVLFIDFELGHSLSLTGKLDVLWLGQGQSLDDADKLAVFDVIQWRWTENPSPFHWRLLDFSSHSPPLSDRPILFSLAAGAPVATSIEKWREAGEKDFVKIELKERLNETPNVATLQFRTERPVRVEPGQYATFHFSIRGTNFIRCWTISSGSRGSTNTIQISVKRIGKVSTWLADAEIGEIKGTVLGFEGSFTLATSARITPIPRHGFCARNWWKVLFISGGIGVTPMMSMAKGLEYDLQNGIVGTDDIPDVCFIHADRSYEEIPLKRDFQRLFKAGIIKGLSFALSREVCHNSPEEKGYPAGTTVTFGHIDPEFITATVPDLKSRVIFLCGPNSFMGAMTSSLKGLGVPMRLILVENFEY